MIFSSQFNQPTFTSTNLASCIVHSEFTPPVIRSCKKKGSNNCVVCFNLLRFNSTDTMLSIEFYSQGAYKATPLGPKPSSYQAPRDRAHAGLQQHALRVSDRRVLLIPPWTTSRKVPPQEPTNYTTWSGFPKLQWHPTCHLATCDLDDCTQPSCIGRQRSTEFRALIRQLTTSRQRKGATLGAMPEAKPSAGDHIYRCYMACEVLCWGKIARKLLDFSFRMLFQIKT